MAHFKKGGSGHIFRTVPKRNIPVGRDPIYRRGDEEDEPGHAIA